MSSIVFLVSYACVIALIYYLVPKGFQRHVLFLSCLFFYAIMDLRFIALMLAVCLISFYLGKLIESGIPKESRIWIIMSTILVIGMFILFRDKIRIMPLGISYLSFRILSYLFDVYHKKRKSESSLLNYIIYVFFFPHVICGPIERSDHIIDQIKKPVMYKPEMIKEGIYLITAGVFKKVVIADRLSGYVNLVYENYDNYNGLALFMAMCFFAVQIYCDFAGYSEIACGLGYLLGIESVVNFRRPFLAMNIAEFWSRWHISLQTWLKDYVYIPLGGGRTGQLRRIVNVLIVFLVSALWHGSGSGYLVWGVFFALGALMPKIEKKESCKNAIGKGLYRCMCRVITFLFFAVGQVFFKTESVGSAIKFLIHMVSDFGIGVNDAVAAVLPFSNDYYCLALFLTVVIMILIELVFELIEEKKQDLDSRYIMIHMAFCVLTILLFGTFGNGNFIYAQY